jgi:hypothetical protein
LAGYRWCDGAFKPAFARDVLDAKGNERGVLAIMVQRVATGETLDNEAGSFV